MPSLLSAPAPFLSGDESHWSFGLNMSTGAALESLSAKYLGSDTRLAANYG